MTTAEKKPVAMATIEIEGYKKIRKIKITPSKNGLTELVGKNKQGKTSVLDAILHGLLGPTYIDRCVSTINHDAEKIEGTKGALARMTFTLDDGTKIERRLTSKNDRTGILEVQLPDGAEGSQEDVLKFFSAAALNPPKLDSMSERERLKWLLAGLKIDISDLEADYDKWTKEKERRYQEKEQARRAFEDLPYYAEAPARVVAMSELTEEYQKAVEHNKVSENATSELRRANDELSEINENIEDYKTQIARLTKKIESATADAEAVGARIKKATAAIRESQPIDIAGISDRMSKVESINEMVRANAAKNAKQTEAEESLSAWRSADKAQASSLAQMAERIKGADVPIDAIGVAFMNNQWVIQFAGEPWANMSGMQRIMFRVAVASLYNPNAKLVLVDGLEALDDEMQENLNAWLVERDLQSIGTAVCSKPSRSNFTKLLIEDGEVK